MGYFYEWNSEESPSSIKDGNVVRCKSQNNVPLLGV